MKSHGRHIFAAGSLSWAVAQWLLVWLFARFAGGAAAVGDYSLTLAVATPVFIVGQFGLRTVYLSLQTNYAWSSYMFLRLAGIALSGLFLLVYFTVTSGGDPWLWGAVIFMKCMDAYIDILYARIQRENRLMHVGLLNLANSSGTIVVAVIAILATGSVPLAILGSGVVSAVVAGFAQRVARVGSHEQILIRAGYRGIIRAGLPTTLGEGLAAVSTYMPLLFLSVIADEAVAGKYATAAYLFTFANLAGSILKNVLITSFRWTFERAGTHKLLQRSHKMGGALGCVGLVAMPAIIFAGSPVLQFVYGEEFAFSYVELTILAFAVLPIAPSYIYSATLNVFNKYSGQAWIWLASCMLGLAVGVLVTMTPEIPVMVCALAVAFATAWGRFIGTLALAVCRRRR